MIGFRCGCTGGQLEFETFYFTIYRPNIETKLASSSFSITTKAEITRDVSRLSKPRYTSSSLPPTSTEPPRKPTSQATSEKIETTTITTVKATTTTTTTTSPTTTTPLPTTTPSTTTIEESLHFETIAPPPYQVVCYFNHTSYRRAKPMSFRTGHVPVPFCGYLVYASVGVSEDFELFTKDPTFDIDQRGLAKFAAHRNSYQRPSVLVAIGEDMEDYLALHSLSKSPTDIEMFAKNVLAWLNLFDYDGVVLQWKQFHESRTGHFRNDMTALVTVLRETLGPTRHICVAVPNDGEIRAAHFDIGALSRKVNMFFVISDWVLRKDGTTDRVRSKITSFPDPLNDVLDAKHSLVSAGKAELFSKFCFILSIGGRSYTLADSVNHDVHAKSIGPGRPGPFTKQPGLLAFYEFCNETWSANVKGTFGSYVTRDDQWVGYLDVDNLERVLWMVLSKHRASCIGLWDVSLDDFRGICGEVFPLTKIIAGWHVKDASDYVDKNTSQ